MKTLAMAIVLALSLSALKTQAQEASPTPGLSGTGGHHRERGQGGERQRPNPENIAARLMEKFDANKDSELEVDELAQALEAIRSHRPNGPEGAGKQRNAQDPQQHVVLSGTSENQQTSAPAEKAEKIAERLIEHFAADKKGLTQDELARALVAFREHHERWERRGPRGERHGKPNGTPGQNPSGQPQTTGSSQ